MDLTFLAWRGKATRYLLKVIHNLHCNYWVGSKHEYGCNNALHRGAGLSRRHGGCALLRQPCPSMQSIIATTFMCQCTTGAAAGQQRLCSSDMRVDVTDGPPCVVPAAFAPIPSGNQGGRA